MPVPFQDWHLLSLIRPDYVFHHLATSRWLQPSILPKARRHCCTVQSSAHRSVMVTAHISHQPVHGTIHILWRYVVYIVYVICQTATQNWCFVGHTCPVACWSYMWCPSSGGSRLCLTTYSSILHICNSLCIKLIRLHVRRCTATRLGLQLASEVGTVNHLSCFRLFWLLRSFKLVKEICLWAPFLCVLLVYASLLQWM